MFTEQSNEHTFGPPGLVTFFTTSSSDWTPRINLLDIRTEIEKICGVVLGKHII
jgi:hypothetical protein